MTGRRAAVLAVVVLTVGAGLAVYGSALRTRGAASPGGPVTADPAQAAAHAPDLADVEGRLTHPRYLQTTRMIAVSVTNTGPSPVQFRRFQLVAPQFAPVEATSRDTLLEPGARLSIPIAYGPVRCDAGAGGTSAVLVTVDRAGGPEPARIPLQAPDPLLERLHATECAQQAITDTAELAFGPFWEAGAEPATARGSVVVRRRSAGAELTVTAIGTTTLFTTRPLDPAEPLLRLGPDAERAELGVEVRASRCDAHAVADSKRGFVFPLWVSLGGVEAQYVTIEPEGEALAVLQRLLDECVAAAGD